MNQQKILLRGDTECPEPMFNQRIVYLIVLLHTTICDGGSAAFAKLGATSIHGTLLLHDRFLLQRHAHAPTSFPDLLICRYYFTFVLERIPLGSTPLHFNPFHSISSPQAARTSRSSRRSYGLVDELKHSTQQQKAVAGVGAPAQTPRIDPVDALTRHASTSS